MQSEREDSKRDRAQQRDGIIKGDRPLSKQLCEKEVATFLARQSPKAKDAHEAHCCFVCYSTNHFFDPSLSLPVRTSVFYSSEYFFQHCPLLSVDMNLLHLPCFVVDFPVLVFVLVRISVL